MHVCMYACMHVCMYACMHVCVYVCMYVCMYACMIMYACMNAWTIGLFGDKFPMTRHRKGPTPKKRLPELLERWALPGQSGQTSLENTMNLWHVCMVFMNAIFESQTSLFPLWGFSSFLHSSQHLFLISCLFHPNASSRSLFPQLRSAEQRNSCEP